MDIQCFICSFKTQEIKLYINHLKAIHCYKEKSEILIQCGFPECKKLFGSSNGLKNHMLECLSKNLIQDDIEDGNDFNIISHDIGNQPCTESTSFASLTPQTVHGVPLIPESITNFLNSFIMQLNLMMITNTTLNFVLKNMKLLLEQVLLFVRNFISEHADDMTFCMENLTTISTMMSEIIEKVETQYRRRKNAFRSVPEPKEISLNISHQERKWNPVSKTFFPVVKTNTFMYISLLDTLKYLLSTSVVQNNLKTRKTNLNVIENLEDCEVFKSCKLYTTEEVILQIQIYYDDFETVNPLGSKVGIHKLGGIYFSIRNLPSHLNTKLHHIHLLSLFYADDLKQVSFNCFLKPIIDDLKILETDGIKVEINGEIKCFKGILAAISADNLGANTMCGFVQCFSIDYFCKICLARYDDIQEMFQEDENIIRTKDLYTDHLQQIQMSTDPKKIHAFGIKDKCLLNELENFNTITNPTVDVMHDFLEGIVPYELNLFFKYLISKRKITLQNLNDKIQSFNFGYLERKNFPSSVNLEKGIGQRAAQTWCLTPYLPLILFEIFDSSDTEIQEYCTLIKLLIKCMRICLSPKITIREIEELPVIISQHHTQFKKIFPNLRLKPKHHNMIHYPRIIKSMGPLVHFWCMRYEGKHNVFKSMAQTHNNYKNVCKMLSYKYQEKLPFYFDHQLEDEIEFEFSSPPQQSVLERIKNIWQKEEYRSFSFLKLVKYIAEYKDNLFIFTDVKKNLPVFQEILALFLYDNEVYALMKLCVTKKFNSALQAFEIEFPENNTVKFEIKKIKELFFPKSFTKTIVNNKYFIVSKISLVK